MDDLFDVLLFVGISKSWKICPRAKVDFNEDDWNELNRRRRIFGMKPLDDAMRS